jgi:hypothetical protein
MPTGTITQIASIGGLSIQAATTRTDDGQIGHEVSLPVGIAGSLTTRTDGNTGIITVAEGHGVLDTDTVDVYWAAGVQYNCDVTAVTADTISIDLGVGDDLPDALTAVVVGKQSVIDTDFDGDLLAMIAASATYRCHLSFNDVGDAVLAAIEILAGEMWSWSSGQGVANPLTGNPVAYVNVSNGSTTGASTLKLGGLYNSV